MDYNVVIISQNNGKRHKWNVFVKSVTKEECEKWIKGYSGKSKTEIVEIKN